MNLKLLTTQFKEDEIEWRIGQCGKQKDGSVWATCLAYVQARAIMNRLDEVCGPENWKASYSFPTTVGVICALSIQIDGQWVTKEDGAEQTEIESFKGGLSSALKRAGSAWGIGRYLYRLESGFAEITQDRKARYGKLPEKLGGDIFYWIEPRLPDWALPEGTVKPPLPPDNPTPSIGPGPIKPGPQDGVQPEPNPNYFTFGQWNRRSFDQVLRDEGAHKMRDYCDFLESPKSRGPLTQEKLQTIHRCREFLDLFEQSEIKPGDFE